VAEDHLDLVQRAAGVDQLAAQPVAELVWSHHPIDSGAPRQRGHRLARSTVAHRSPHLAAAEVDEHEIRA
jgi:hypothetical protein